MCYFTAHEHSLTVHSRGGALLHPKSLAAAQGLSGRAMLTPTIESQKSDIFLRKPCLLLVGACIAGPHSCCGISLGLQAGKMRAGQALPLLRNHETALIITHSPRGPHYRGGSAPPEEPCGVTELKRASNARPYDRITKERYIFAKTLPFACRGLHCRPANGAACDWHSRSPPIRAKTFFYSKKRPASVSLAGLISWCTISGSVQKTVQCTVFSDRSPRGECKPHRGAARARPVGDGAPPTSLSAALNAKKDPQTKPFAGLSSWCTISGSV